MPDTAKRPSRILSLDGGGSWAMIQVRALMAIYGDVTGHEVLSHFDLVVANSGGSITAGALYSNVRLSEALTFFKTEKWRRALFVEKMWPIPDITRKLEFGPRYQADKKILGLRRLFGQEGAGSKGGIAVGDMAVTDLPGLLHSPRKTHLVILAFDYWRKRATFFRSDTASAAASGQTTRTTLAEAVHASSNAPINYFDAPARVNGRLYWDGGIAGYNNPVMAGVTEVLAGGIAAINIGVLSIGTGSVVLPQAPAEVPDKRIYEEYQSPGPLNDIMELAKSIIDDPPDAASFTAHVTLGGMQTAYCPLVRLNPLIQPVRNEADTGWQPLPANYVDDFKLLRDLDMDAVEQDQVDAIDRLCDRWLGPDKVVPNQPIRWNRENLTCQIGHRWAREAINDWLTMPE